MQNLLDYCDSEESSQSQHDIDEPTGNSDSCDIPDRTCVAITADNNVHKKISLISAVDLFEVQRDTIFVPKDNKEFIVAPTMDIKNSVGMSVLNSYIIMIYV